MKNLKNILLFAIVFALIASFSACELKEYKPCDDALLVFDGLEDGTFRVSAKEGAELPEVLCLPEVHAGKAVTEVADEGFMGVGKVKEVRVPASYKEIGRNAFSGIPSLEKVYFYNGSSVKRAEGEGYVFEKGVEVIGEGAFNICENLKEVTLPDNLRIIEKSAFRLCALSRVKLKSEVEELGPSSFALCKNLSRINIPAKLEKIGDRAFEGCNDIEFEIAKENTHYCLKEGKLVRK